MASHAARSEPWAWETATARERREWIRHHARMERPLSVKQLAELFQMETPEIEAVLASREPWGIT